MALIEFNTFLLALTAPSNRNCIFTLEITPVRTVQHYYRGYGKKRNV